MKRKLYGRNVQVKVGKRGGKTLLITGLRIVFKIEKTLEKTPNNSMIEVYNVSPETQAFFEKKDAAIQVLAGYGEHPKVIFTGDIAVASAKKSGADTIMSIEAGDGLLDYQTKEADLSFSAGTKVGTVLDQLTSAFGLTKGEVQGLNTNDSYLNGLALSGKVKDHVDTLLQKQPDLSWSIQNNQLQIIPKVKALTQSAVLLSAETGLIGSPFKRTVINQDIAKKKDGRFVDNGCTFKSLINAEIVPGRLIVIKADLVHGTFKVEKVVHSGDTFSQTYYSDGEAVTIT